MSNVYRLRPSTQRTIEELTENYIWFSRPCEFNDNDDANIVAFAEANENIKQALNRVFASYSTFAEQISLSGICCFSKSLPEFNVWKKFPGGNSGIFIEYDKEKLEEHFICRYGIGNCFKDVEYLLDQLTFRSSTEQGYDVLWTIDDDGGLIYKSLEGSVMRDPRDMEKFLFKLLTRINIRYSIQNETRIILGGRNIPASSPGTKGYKISIPADFITKIYSHPNTPQDFVDELQRVIPTTPIEACSP